MSNLCRKAKIKLSGAQYRKQALEKARRDKKVLENIPKWIAFFKLKQKNQKKMSREKSQVSIIFY